MLRGMGEEHMFPGVWIAEMVDKVCGRSKKWSRQL